MENTPSKGMSKGCLIWLIIGGFLLVAAIVGISIFIYYLEDVTRWITSLTVERAKVILGEHPAEDVDTVVFNAVSDGFLERLTEDDSLRYDEAVNVVQTLQNIIGDEAIDAREAEIALDAIVAYFPDLEAMRPTTEEPEPAIEEDTLSTE